MPTLITNPSAGDLSPVDKFHVVEGGTGGNTVETALQNLNGIPSEMYAQVNGPVPLNGDRKIDPAYLSDFNPNAISVNGPAVVRCGTVTPYQIVNFDSYIEYAVAAAQGTVYITGDHVFYTPPDDAGDYGFTVNDRIVPVTAIEGLIRKPVILTPTANTAPSNMTLIVQGSVFECVDTGPIYEAFSSADCEISASPEFTELTRAIYNNPNTTFTFNTFQDSVGSYIRIRYHGTERSSDWSDVIMISPAETYIEPPVILSPTQAGTAGIPNPNNVYRSNVAVDIFISPFTVVNMVESFVSTEYQISTNPDFTQIPASVNAGDAETSWTATLLYNTLYYVRARHYGVSHVSEWSNVVSFMTVPDMRYIAKPTITNAVVDSAHSTLTYDVTASPPSPVGYPGYPMSVGFQVAHDANFLYNSVDYNAPIGEISFNPDNYNTPYYLRLRYYDSIKSSPWSDTYTLNTVSDDRIIQTPSITSPVNNAIDVSLTPTITSTDFQTSSSQVAYHDTHVYTDWELSRTANFSEITASSYNDEFNKTSWTPSGLNFGLPYYVRCRYHGSLKVSNWSPVVQFTAVPFISPAYYAHDNGVLNTAPSTQYFRVKKVGEDLYYALSNAMAWVKWTGAVSEWSTITYGTLWRNEGEAIRVSGLQLMNASMIRVWIEFYDANVGIRWGNYVDISIYGVGIETPALSIQGGSMNTPVTPVLNSTAFNVIDTWDSHISTDWEIATDSNFANIVAYRSGDTVNKTSWTPAITLTRGSTYYARVRYHGSTYNSSWSAVVQFLVENILAPVISINTGSNSSLDIIYYVNAFTPSGDNNTLVSTDWQIATDPAFTNIVRSGTGTTVYDAMSHSSEVFYKDRYRVYPYLNYSTTYYTRARFNGNTRTSAWSETHVFTTIADNRSIKRPSMPTLEIDVIGQFFDSDPFVAYNFVGAHEYTDWQISLNTSFTNLVATYTGDTNNGQLTWWRFPRAQCPDNTTLYVRCRYRSQGIISPWSMMQTVAFVYDPGAQGGG